MSSHFEKPPDEKPANTGDIDSEDLTDWARFEAMDDDDIVFDDDSPELPPGWGNSGVYRVGERLATPQEIEEFKRRVLAYANRPRPSK